MHFIRAEKWSLALSEVRALPADPSDAARDMLTKDGLLKYLKYGYL